MPERKKRPAKEKFIGKFEALAQPLLLERPPELPGNLMLLLCPENQKRYEEDKRIWLQQLDTHKEKAAERLGLLLDYYDIPRDEPERWFLLAWTLAQEVAPGLALTIQCRGRPKGIKKAWPDARLALLYRTVKQEQEQRIKEKKPDSNKVIFAALKKQEPWKSMKSTEKSLSNRYAEACKHAVICLLERMTKSNPTPEMAQLVSETWEKILNKKLPE